MNEPGGWRSSLLAAIVALLAGGLLLVATGHELGLVVGAFWRGTFGSVANVTETLVAATPLLLCALSVAISFRAGLFNIGAEGQLLVGMLAATWIGTSMPGVTAIGALLASVLAGGLFAAVAAWMKIRRGVPEVLATLLLNFVAIYLVSLAVHGPLQEAAKTLPRSDRIAVLCELPRLIAGTRFHLGIGLAVLVTLAIDRMLRETRFGLRVRAIGASDRAARVAGFPVDRDLFVTFLIAGGLAGLAGGVEILGVTRVLYEKPSPGFGYAAIAVALLGQLHPIGVAGGALFFGLLENGGGALQRHAGVSSGFVQVLQGGAIVAFLLLEARRRLRNRSGVASSTPAAK